MGDDLLAPHAADALARAFAAERAREIASCAVARGLLSAAACAEAEEDADRDRRSLTAVLVERGLVAAAALEDIEAALAAEAFTRPEQVRATEEPPEVREARRDPTRHLGRFVLVSVVGRGGTAEVWKAWDTRLGRFVAIKIAIAAVTSESARDRFAREVLAAGRLSHPNIVPVHEWDLTDGRPYLVMPLVEGQTLDGKKFGARDAMMMIRTAALAVDHAHRHGMVHRDLKPANLISNQAGEIMVLDFGLVSLREEVASRLTQPGDVLGTGAYMSPEQARGESARADPTTDVYGLGATLYALVTGRPPHPGESLAVVVARVLNSEVVSPRQLEPGIDRELEAVILKALEKDPRRRYATAAALAEDLARILAGDPAQARHPGPWRRLGRQVRRRPALASVAVAAAVVMAALAIGRLKLAGERRAAVTALQEVVETSLDAALRLRRAGDTAGMRRLLPQVVAAYERTERYGASLAAVEFAMGRAYRALLDDGRALVHQERALAIDPSYAPALYEHAVLLSQSYGRALAELLPVVRSPSGSDDPRRLVAAAEAIRPSLTPMHERILQDTTRLASLTLGSVDADAARGILAYHQRRPAEARAILKKVVAVDPFREEAWETLARTEEAEGSLRGAEATYTAALARDAGYAPHLVARCAIRCLFHEPRRTAEATADADRALALAPDLIDALLCRAAARTEAAHNQMVAGQDPRPRLLAALGDFDRVLARAPDRASGLAGRGRTWRYVAIDQEATGGDPLAALDRSEADLGRAAMLEPTVAEHWSSRGRTRTRRARYRMRQGEDPRPDLDGAEADLNQAVRLEPGRGVMWEWRGDVLAHRGLFHLLEKDLVAAERAFAAAEPDLERAAKRPPFEAWVLVSRGNMRLWRGEAQRRAGGDPEPHWSGAEADFTAAIARDSGLSWARTARARLQLARACAGRADRHALDAASEDVARAIALNPVDAEAWAAQGTVALVRGQPSLAREAFARAAALNGALARRLPAPVPSACPTALWF